jgi:hypothetical protein
MASLGWYLIIFGVGSGLMSIFNHEFTLLTWIDSWGDGFAWLIRGGFILGGMALVSRGQKQQHRKVQAVRRTPHGPASR